VRVADKCIALAAGTVHNYFTSRSEARYRHRSAISAYPMHLHSRLEPLLGS